MPILRKDKHAVAIAAFFLASEQTLSIHCKQIEISTFYRNV